MKHFWYSHLTLVLMAIAAFFYGGMGIVITVLMLASLEVSLSFDNAVVNAKILNTMEAKWRQRFIIWGIPIAVFGMRFIFPIAIVAFAANMSMLDTLNMVMNDHEAFKHHLEDNKLGIYAFGGSFLLMVFLSWLFSEKEHVWLDILEDNLIIRKLSEIGHMNVLLAMAVGIYLANETQNMTVVLAYFGGILLYEAIQALGDMFGEEDSTGSVVRSGLVGFLYLEVLDASFSFDGVIGAFALSSDLIVITSGLFVGALYVRSLTIYMVDKKTLSEYIYLESGAHYAIGALAGIMFCKMFFEVNELIVGGVGIGFILIAFIHSMVGGNKSV